MSLNQSIQDFFIELSREYDIANLFNGAKAVQPSRIGLSNAKLEEVFPNLYQSLEASKLLGNDDARTPGSLELDIKEPGLRSEINLPLSEYSSSSFGSKDFDSSWLAGKAGDDDDDDDDDDDSCSRFDCGSKKSNELLCTELVTSWNQLALDLGASSKRGPTIVSRLYAYINTALYDCWAHFDKNAIGAIFQGDPSCDLDDDVLAASMANAANLVFRWIGESMVGSAALTAFTSRADALVAAAEAGLSSEERTEAEELGGRVAEAIKAWAENDGANQAGNYADTTGYQPAASVFDPTATEPRLDSTWQPLEGQRALTPHWGGVTPLGPLDLQALTPPSIEEPYGSDGALNPVFVQELNQVLAYSQNLTAEQKAIAEYWEYGPTTSYPPGKWLEFTNAIIEQSNLSFEKAIQLSFGVSQALFDAGIAAWNTKYLFDSVRPITAIQQFYNNELISDWRNTPILGQDWQPYQSVASLTPPFPDVVSGHSTFSAAASAIITNLLGTSVFGFSTTLADQQARFDPNGFDGIANGSSGNPITLSWAYFNTAAEQAGLSRLYGGIHFNQGNLLGQIMGLQVGDFITSQLNTLFTGTQTKSAAELLFGTTSQDRLEYDTITGSNVDTLKIYGFGGDDILIANGGFESTELFGGDGRDVFVISDNARGTKIRDYQENELIAFDPSIDIARITTVLSESGPAFTSLNYNNKELATLDGHWIADSLQLGTQSIAFTA
ncbi:vanadium-dependent haloperoxidase [Synechococcus sp. FGCU-3]|nr:vanadium-dependent haloperoxidase [Synechococcus sp. FGCU3]